jgi:hypothetical protein
LEATGDERVASVEDDAHGDFRYGKVVAIVKS